MGVEDPRIVFIVAQFSDPVPPRVKADRTIQDVLLPGRADGTMVYAFDQRVRRSKKSRRAMALKSGSGKGRGGSSARRRAKKGGTRSTASSPTTSPRNPVFVDETALGTQEAIVGAPDKPRR